MKLSFELRFALKFTTLALLVGALGIPFNKIEGYQSVAAAMGWLAVSMFTFFYFMATFFKEI